MTTRFALRRRAGGGYTLTELLIVMAIMVMLVAVSLPVAKKVMDDSHVREASRQLNGFFTMAKVRAAQTGRPCGVWMKCDLPLGVPVGTANAPRLATKFYLAEVPPPYAGDTFATTARVDTSAGVNGPWPMQFYVPTPPPNPPNPDSTSAATLRALVGDGEFQIRFNYKGPWFTGTVDATTGQVSIARPASLPRIVPQTGPSGGAGVPFQILRKPQRVGNPMELSSGSCLDLCYSGMGPQSVGFVPGAAPNAQLFSLQSGFRYPNLIIMFLPSGGIEGIYFVDDETTPANIRTTLFAAAPTGDLHFLVGKVQRINLPLGANAEHVSGRYMFDPAQSNLLDPTSLWLSISRANGTVTTSENTPPSIDPASVGNTSLSYLASSGSLQQLRYSNLAELGLFLRASREIATGREQMGGL